jgi:hypothetical protein
VLCEEHNYSNSIMIKKIRLTNKNNPSDNIFNFLVGKSMIKCMPWAVMTLKPRMIYQATSFICHLNRQTMTNQVLTTNENVGIVIVLVVILIIAAVLV